MKTCKHPLLAHIIPCILHTGLMVATLAVSCETLKRVRKTRHEIKKFERPLELLEAVRILREERKERKERKGSKK